MDAAVQDEREGDGGSDGLSSKDVHQQAGFTASTVANDDELSAKFRHVSRYVCGMRAKKMSRWV